MWGVGLMPTRAVSSRGKRALAVAVKMQPPPHTSLLVVLSMLLIGDKRLHILPVRICYTGPIGNVSRSKCNQAYALFICLGAYSAQTHEWQTVGEKQRGDSLVQLPTGGQHREHDTTVYGWIKFPRVLSRLNVVKNGVHKLRPLHHPPTHFNRAPGKGQTTNRKEESDSVAVTCRSSPAPLTGDLGGGQPQQHGGTMKKNIIILWLLVILSLSANAYNYIHFTNWVGVTQSILGVVLDILQHLVK
jgi:hypothetical protein